MREQRSDHDQRRAAHALPADRPDQHQQQPDPQRVLQDEGCGVTPAALGPGGRVLGIVGIGQPRAVIPPPPRQMYRDTQERERPPERPQAHAQGMAVRQDPVRQESSRPQDRDHPVGPRQGGEQRGEADPEHPGRATVLAPGQPLVDPENEAEVEQRRLEPRAQPSEERAVGHRSQEDQSEEGEANAFEPRGKTDPTDQTVDDEQSAVAEREGKVVGGVWRIDTGQTPDETQQRDPQPARVPLHGQEGRRIPDEAAPQHVVADVAERDVRVVGREQKETGPQEDGNPHRGGERDCAQTRDRQARRPHSEPVREEASCAALLVNRPISRWRNWRCSRKCTTRSWRGPPGERRPPAPSVHPLKRRRRPSDVKAP